MDTHKLRNIRNSRGLRLEDVAELLGDLDDTSLSRIERGLQTLTYDRACQLADIYQVSVAEFRSSAS